MKIIILGGFLGSGKTTVLLQLAKYITQLPGEPNAVILENEIGEVGVDNQMLSGSAFSVENIFSGCVCCSGAMDLVDAVKKIEADFAPDWLLLEATGMALPSSIRETLTNSFGYSAYVMTVADANRWSRIIKVSPDFANDQLKGADCVIMTKIDKADSEKLAAAKGDIQSRVGNAKVFGVCAVKPIEAELFAEITASVPEN